LLFVWFGLVGSSRYLMVESGISSCREREARSHGTAAQEENPMVSVVEIRRRRWVRAAHVPNLLLLKRWHC